MKTKLIIMTLVSLLSIGTLSSCSDEEVRPVGEQPVKVKQKGSTSSDGF